MLITPQIGRLFLQHVFRHARRHKLLAVLNIGGVALGVAVFFAIQIANRSARHSFEDSVDLVAGKAHLEVRSESAPLPDTLLPQIAALPEVEAATPLVEGLATLPDHPGEYLQILGADIFTAPPFLSYRLTDAPAASIAENPAASPSAAAPGFTAENWLARPRQLALTRSFATKLGLRPGDTLRLLVAGQVRTVDISFLLEPESGLEAAAARFAVMDIGWAQELLGLQGKLSAVQIRLRDPLALDPAIAALRPLLPSAAAASPPAQRNRQTQKMLSGFQLNLTALSMVSMLIGMFLIYNTVSATVVRRRRETGILRSLGASRTEIRLLFLGEALLYAVAGVTLGLLLGALLATVLIGLVGRTVATVYNVLHAEGGLFLSPWEIGLTALFGVGATLLAAWFPADQGARLPPVEALSPGAAQERATLHAPRWFLAGVVSLALAGLASWAALATGPPWLGFIAAFLVLFGFALLTPLLAREFSIWLVRMSGLLPGPAAPAFLLQLGAANLGRSLFRSAVTVSALGAAIALVIGVGVMVHSFRLTVRNWVEGGFVADLYLAPASSAVVGLQAFMPPETLDFLRAHPKVASLDTFRELRVPFRDGDTISLASVEGGRNATMRFIGGNDKAKLALFQTPGYVIATESFARKHHVREGEEITLPAPDGPARFRIAGVYYDYTKENGLLAIYAPNFRALWHDDRIHSAGVILRPGADAEADAETVEREFREKFSTSGEYIIYTNASLRKRVFEIFDQTFAITGVLRSIAVVVAIIGITLGLATLVTERQREIGVLRATGASGRQIAGIFLGEAAALGMLSSVIGLAAGICLSLVLTWVINLAFFGWTLTLSIPWGQLAFTPVWVIAASLLAGWLPARRAGKVPIAAAVRFE